MTVGEGVREAAAVLLHRPGGDGREVLLVRRAPDRSFFPDHWALPGGGLEPGDGPPGEERSWRRAACRELAEETGVVLATGDEGPDAAARRRVQEALVDRARGFPELLDDVGVRLDLDALEPMGRLLTPGFLPLRFDTRWYAAEMPAGQDVEVRGDELAEGRWWRPGELLDAWDRLDALVAPPVLLMVRVLAREGVRAGIRAFAQVDTSEAGGDREPYIEVRPGVRMLPLAAPTLPPNDTQNCVVLGRDELLVVDPGTPHQEERDHLASLLDTMLEDEGAAGVRAVLLTHPHEDHVGSARWIADRYGAPVMAHPRTADELADRVPVDDELADGTVLELGSWAPTGEPFRVRCVHTPGHHPGHLCFLDERFGGTLVAGDMVAGRGTVLVDPDAGSMADYVESLRRLVELAPALVVPGHGPFLPRAQKDVLAETLDHRLWREGKLLDHLDRTPRDLDALLPEVYDDAPDEALPLARRSLRAHLDKLAVEGRVVQEGEGWRRVVG